MGFEDILKLLGAQGQQNQPPPVAPVAPVAGAAPLAPLPGGAPPANALHQSPFDNMMSIANGAEKGKSSPLGTILKLFGI